MEDELEKTPINSPETVGEITAPEAAEPETSAETTEEQANPNPNQKAIDYVNRFAQGMPTNSPEEIIEGLVKALDITSIPYDELYDVATNSPEAAAFAHDLLKIGDPLKALVRNYDPEEIQAVMEDMKENDDYEGDRQLHTSKVEGTKAYKAHQEENLKLTQEGAEQFLDEINPSEEDQAGFIAFTDEFLMDAADNKLSKERWMALWQAFKYPTAVSEAEENGKIMGKNEKIMTGKKTQKDLNELLPEGGGAVTPKPTMQPKEDGFMAGLRRKVEEKPVL